MAYEALQRLRWGDGWIEPGEDVPAGERGRNYAALLAAGRIAVKEDSRKREPAPEPEKAAGDDSPEEPAADPAEPQEEPEPKATTATKRKPASKPKAKASGRKGK